MGSSCVGYEWYWSGCSGAVEWGCSTREEKLGVGGDPSTGGAIPDQMQSPVGQEQWPLPLATECYWTRQDPGPTWAACSGAAGHGARDRTGDKAAYIKGEDGAGWSGQSTQGCDCLRALGLLCTSSPIFQRGWPCSAGGLCTGCCHINPPVTFTPALLLWLLALSSLPEISKALSQRPRKSFGFFPLASVWLEPASYWEGFSWSPSTAEECAAFFTRKKGHKSVERFRSGDSQESLLANGWRDFNY